MGVRLLVRSCWGDGSNAAHAFEFEQTRITIGRGRGADVCLPNSAVSVRHATIETDGVRSFITDHHSTNGTKVGGMAVVPTRKKPLRDADIIEIGGFELAFSSGVPVSNPTTVRSTRDLALQLLGDGQSNPRPTLTLINGRDAGRVIDLPPGPAVMRIGRGEESELWLPDADLSRVHAELRIDDKRVEIVDRESKNGVFVANHRIERHFLSDRDEFTVGSSVLRFESPESEPALDLDEVLELSDEARDCPSPRGSTPPPPEEEEAAPDAVAEDHAPPPIQKPAPSGLPAMEVMVYLLAAVVLGLSALGLLWILR